MAVKPPLQTGVSMIQVFIAADGLTVLYGLYVDYWNSACFSLWALCSDLDSDVISVTDLDGYPCHHDRIELIVSLWAQRSDLERDVILVTDLDRYPCHQGRIELIVQFK
jgi:hypothetical protein